MNTDTSRRDLLKVAPIVALAAAIPAAARSNDMNMMTRIQARELAASDRGAWDFAMTRFKAAEQIAEAYDAQTFNPLYEWETAFEEAHGVTLLAPGAGYIAKRNALYREHGTAHVVPETINDEHDRLWEVAGDAKWELLDIPAPDQAALRWKLELLLGDSSSAAETLADIARLLPQGR